MNNRELSFEQTEQQNEDAFVERLVRAGWTRQDAEQEWNNIQEDDESDL